MRSRKDAVTDERLAPAPKGAVPGKRNDEYRMEFVSNMNSVVRLKKKRTKLF
jgi:hypothetical protein